MSSDASPRSLDRNGKSRMRNIQLTAPGPAWFGGDHVHVRCRPALLGQSGRRRARGVARQRDHFRHLVCHRDDCVSDLRSQAPVPATSELTQSPLRTCTEAAGIPRRPFFMCGHTIHRPTPNPNPNPNRTTVHSRKE